MSALVEFLLARIAEDEVGNGCDGEGEYQTCWRRSERIDRECEAKRRIVAAARFADDVEGGGAAIVMYDGYPRDGIPGVLPALAAIYAEHPDYDQAWRP